MIENQEIGDVPAVEAPEEPAVAVSSRPRRNVCAPQRYGDFVMYYPDSDHIEALSVVDDDNPASYEQLLNSGVSREWQAMQDEYNALADNETWHLVPGSSGRRRVVGASGYTTSNVGLRGKLTSRKRGMSYKDLVRCLGWGTTKAHSHKQTDFIENLMY